MKLTTATNNEFLKIILNQYAGMENSVKSNVNNPLFD